LRRAKFTKNETNCRKPSSLNVEGGAKFLEFWRWRSGEINRIEQTALLIFGFAHSQVGLGVIRMMPTGRTLACLLEYLVPPLSSGEVGTASRDFPHPRLRAARGRAAGLIIAALR
jgi:hypothetical protein